jgi:hypothetical protein
LVKSTFFDLGAHSVYSADWRRFTEAVDKADRRQP